MPLLYSARDRASFYLVSSSKLLNDDPRFLLLDQHYCLLTFESWLIVRDWDCCETIKILRPSRLASTDVGKVIKEIWNSKLSTDNKKLLVNRLIGNLLKRTNESIDTKLFQDCDEANAYAHPLGIHPLHMNLGEKTVYFVSQMTQKDYVDGFYPIGHIVLDAQRRALYKRAVQVDRQILGVNTDCIYFLGTEPVIEKDHSAAGIGNWSVQCPDSMPSNDPFQKQRNVALLGLLATCSSNPWFSQ